ncbi:MAG TPA: MFS transporter [Solirubrobacterales bacterium]|jgi:MFS family permease|nr:MFS transporter [Solirubrobacterales bacterium]
MREHAWNSLWGIEELAGKLVDLVEAAGNAAIIDATAATKEPTAASSPWAPLRIGVFRVLWLTTLVDFTGNWFQTVGAQWLLIDEPHASILVALVQTATALPFVLFGLIGGVLADTLDRRWLMFSVQAAMTAVGALLAALTFSGQIPPTLLLLLVFLLGTGIALTTPAYQSLVPDLVSRSEIPAAAALNSISVNLARVVGPAVAGALVASAGVGTTFTVAAATSACYATVLLLWRRPPPPRPTPEPFVAALRAGGRYVEHAPVVRRILLRAGLFLVPASSLFALLPLIASRQLGLGAGGYGFLLAAIGVGAISGVLLLPKVRTRLSLNLMIAAASGLYVAVFAAIALLHDVVLVLVLLVPAGAAWVVVLSTVNAALQLFLPGWVRGRSLALYQTVLFGSQALGALLFGLLAAGVGLSAALLTAAGVTALGVATMRPWPFIDTSDMDRSPVAYWPEPLIAADVSPEGRTVFVSVTYAVSEDDQPAFVERMARVRESRLRTGATSWGLYQQGEDGRSFVEMFAVASWEEHLRQHDERLTGTDRDYQESVERLSESPPEVRHLISVAVPGASRRI